MGERRDTTTVYTIDELRAIVRPLAEEYGMRSAALFGSYARGDADGRSDIDLLLDRGCARALSIFGVAEGVSEATGKEVDVVDVSQLLPGPCGTRRCPRRSRCERPRPRVRARPAHV